MAPVVGVDDPAFEGDPGERGGGHHERALQRAAPHRAAEADE